MKKIVICPLGIFVLENQKVLDKKLFPKDPKQVAEKLKAIESRQEPEELKEIKKRHPEAKVQRSVRTKQVSSSGWNRKIKTFNFESQKKGQTSNSSCLSNQ